MIAIRSAFPHPALSVFLLLIWLLLNNTLAPGHVVLGIVLAVCMPLLTSRLPRRKRSRRRLKAQKRTRKR